MLTLCTSVLQMDELDPLIMSLEEFINEQHSPPYVPEDEVLRYPVMLGQRKVFPGVFGVRIFFRQERQNDVVSVDERELGC